jgi:hypothetical protein
MATAPTTLNDIVSHGALIGVAQPAQPSLADFYHTLGTSGLAQNLYGQGTQTWGGNAQVSLNEPTWGTETQRNDLLGRLQKFDPNASISYQTYSGGGDDPSQYGSWVANVDMSKLPRPVTAAGKTSAQSPARVAELQRAGIDPTGFFDTNNIASTSVAKNGLRNPNLVWQDPVYGQLTDTRNIKQESPGWLDMLGPMAVMGVGALLGGLPALAGASMVQAGTGAAQGFSSGNPLGGILSLAGPVAGVPSYLTSLLRMAYQPPRTGG